jgi:hypothetical protein
MHRILLLLLLVILSTACGRADQAEGEHRPPLPTPSPSAERPGPAADIVIDLTRPSSGMLGVELAIAGVEAKTFRAMGGPPEYAYSDVQFWDEDGDRASHKVENRLYKLGSDPGDSVRVRYRVKPGGEGRHGNQGAVTDEFAVFDGRIFLLPLGVNDLRSARIRFDVPDGWTVASPFRKEAEWWIVDQFAPELTGDELASSCMGAGLFDQVTKQFGGTEMRVFSFSKWSEGHKKKLADKSFRMFQWFHERQSFDLGAPYITVWTPKTSELRLFGGSHANGTCYEHPKDSMRNWQLLGHRLGHALNKYNPSGMLLRDARDKWFKEGYASYVEVMATVGSGVDRNEAYWNTLYKRYHNMIEAEPGIDAALGDEPHAPSESIEFLHYTKAPLVTKMLDVWMQQRTGKSMEQFMAAMWPRYGMYKGMFPLREELEAFTGASLDEFWSVAVDQTGTVIPVWEEAVTASVKTKAKASPAATVGGQPISGEYLHKLASSGDFDRFADIRDFLIAEERRRRELKAHGVQLLPDVVVANLNGLSPETRYDIARYEASWRLDLWPGLDGAKGERRPEIAAGSENAGAEPGATGAEPEEKAAAPAGAGETAIDLVLDTSNEDGRAFAELLAREEAYEAAVPSSGVSAIVLHVGDKDGPEPLAFDGEEKIVLGTKWLWAPAKAVATVLEGESDGKARPVQIRPGWTRTWFHFGPGDLPEEGNIVEFRVTGDKVNVTRAFWLRR